MPERFHASLIRGALALLALVLLSTCGRLLTPDQSAEITEARAGTFVLDSNHAALLFKLNHLGFSTFLGRFEAFDASLDFDPEDVENASLEVIVDMASINVNHPEFEQELRGEDWLDVANFPQAVYRTTSLLEAIDENRLVYAGELTFHGVTAPVNLQVEFRGGGRNFLTRSYTLGFAGSATFLRSDFGVDRFTRFGVGDEIELEVHVEFSEADT